MFVVKAMIKDKIEVLLVSEGICCQCFSSRSNMMIGLYFREQLTCC